MAIRHQPFHRFVIAIRDCCQRRILHHGQVMDIAINSVIKFHNAGGSCAGSIPPSGAFCGSLLAGFLLQYIGRKNTILISSPLATIGWILIATATRYEIVIFGRFITGFCVGLCLPSAQVYVNNKTTIANFEYFGSNMATIWCHKSNFWCYLKRNLDVRIRNFRFQMCIFRCTKKFYPKKNCRFHPE